MTRSDPPPIRGRDHNWSWAFSGTYGLLAALCLPVMLWPSISDAAVIAIGFLGTIFLVLTIQHASTTLTYTPTTIRCTRIFDAALDRRSFKAAPVQLDRLTSVTYWEFRDMELRLADDEGHLVRIDVSTRWPRVSDWGTLVLTWAERRGVPVAEDAEQVLRRGIGRWLESSG